jgi:threonine synthase
VLNLALEGDFDGTQAILKQVLADEQFRRKTGLAAVNSINWVRVAAQSVYFAQAQTQLGAGRPIRFVVPTGNFGDALAGYVAWRCGLVAKLDIVAAVNANDAMARLLGGQALTKGETAATLSPAMDIQLPSNFERLLFEATGRNGAAVANAYAQLAERGKSDLPAGAGAWFAGQGFGAERVSDEETVDEMRRTLAETGWVVCPHTAVGLAAARRRPADGPVVTLATAHAAKFPETVQQALGLKIGLPPRAEEFTRRPEKFETGPMSTDFVRKRIEAMTGRR